ncbi:TonB-dependent hemoglobin/transferrin/lactoferrin family receptor [Sphingomonas sp. BK345]|uniref:TonB-dependent hemoglobin/transferrin/lactoferrin family receptor n=1 Tax=Sphingomonas sp. BK345 TaxID=2586980 RepID=UPI001618B1F3|nr:TonB-dependent hemoglobin/transferrin/lactoferrin family receptor [Sphingomonas sp. BK345]MBB3474195.1 hemoglobin/transferrin/lactoferrin receptor protein [Sphingomonas sp. BK345]
MGRYQPWFGAAAAAALAGGAPSADAAPTPPASDAPAEVTVTATRAAKPAEDVPVTVTVIGAETIADQLAGGIKALVRYEPGVSVRRAPARFSAAGSSTGRDRDSGFTVRGLDGNRVMITVDGVRVPDAFGFGAQSVGRGDYVDLDLIRSVELLRGPASALYGSDGVAGAVSFITKDPADLLAADARVGGGARIGYDGSDASWTKGLTVAGRDGALSAMLAYTRRDGHAPRNRGSDTSASPLRTAPDPQDSASDALLARLAWTPGARSRVRLTYERLASTVATDVLSAHALPPLTARSVIGLTALDRLGRARGTIDYAYQGSGALAGIRAAAYVQSSTSAQNSWEDRLAAPDRVRRNLFDNALYGGLLQLDSRATTGGITHRLVYGADYAHLCQRGLRDGLVPPAGDHFPTRAFPTTDDAHLGLFAQDEIALAGGALTLFPALRHDRYALTPRVDPLFTAFAARSQHGARWTPRLGAVARAGALVRLFANYSEGFRPPEPSQVNNGFVNPVAHYSSQPNPALRPETSRSVEAGTRLVAPRWSLSGTVFDSRFRDFIDQALVAGRFTAADPAVYRYINRYRVTIRGVEAKGEWRLDGGAGLHAAATYARGRTRAPDAPDALPLDSVDPFTLVTGLFYRPDDAVLSGAIDLTHAAHKHAGDVPPTCGDGSERCFTPPGFWVLDATAALALRGGATLRAGVFNLTDRRYFRWSDVRDLAADASARDAYSQAGRTAAVSLTQRF